MYVEKIPRSRVLPVMFVYEWIYSPSVRSQPRKVCGSGAKKCWHRWQRWEETIQRCSQGNNLALGKDPLCSGYRVINFNGDQLQSSYSKVVSVNYGL